MKHFSWFVLAYSIQDPFLVQELLLSYFGAYLARIGLAQQIVRGYLAAVRNAQISMGLPDPREQSSLPLLRRVQAGISRIRQQSGSHHPKVRQPITVPILERMHNAWVSSTNSDRTMLWAVTAVASSGSSDLSNSSQKPHHPGRWKKTWHGEM